MSHFVMIPVGTALLGLGNFVKGVAKASFGLGNALAESANTASTGAGTGIALTGAFFSDVVGVASFGLALLPIGMGSMVLGRGVYDLTQSLCGFSKVAVVSGIAASILSIKASMR